MQVLGPTEADFGVVIAASPEHVHWVMGACASIRYFMDDTPICLLLDGNRSAGHVKATYGVSVIRQKEIDHPGLRALSGSTKAKLAAHWVGPFETFLFLDADTIVWGDVRTLADLDRFDLVVDSPLGASRSSRGVMDADAVSRHFPQFDAHRYQGSYVNSGAFFARRGSFDLDRCLELVGFARNHPGVLIGEQGIFNLMLFAGADAGTLRVDQRELQVKVGHMRREELARRFAFVAGEPKLVDAPVVVHWVNTPKPRMRGRKADFFEPMTFFRRQSRVAKRHGAAPRVRDELRLRLEDMLRADYRGSNVLGRLRRAGRRIAKRANHGVRRVRIRFRTRMS